MSILAVLAGVWIRIEVASRFDWSNRLYQQGASSPRFHAVSGRMLPQTMFKLQSLHTRFLVLIERTKLSAKEQIIWIPAVSQILMYRQLPTTLTFKGNQKTFELEGVQVIRSSEKIVGSKGKNSFYCTVNILITVNCRNVK